MTRRLLSFDGSFDLPGTLGPLVRGHGDRTIRIASHEAWWATRTAAGPATLHLSAAPGVLTAEAWGPGAELVVERAGRLVGLQPTRPPTGALAEIDDARISG